MASARGALTATLGQIYGARTQATQQAQAGQVFGVTSAGATAALSKGDIGVRLQQSVGDLNAGRQKELDLNEANRSADTRRWYGDKLIRGSSWGGEKIRELSKGSEHEGKWKVGAAVVELGPPRRLQYPRQIREVAMQVANCFVRRFGLGKQHGH